MNIYPKEGITIYKLNAKHKIEYEIFAAASEYNIIYHQKLKSDYKIYHIGFTFNI